MGFITRALYGSGGSSGSNPIGWYPVKIGGGGYCTGGDMHPDGTMITRVDVNSLYIGNVTLGAPWVNAWNAAGLPSTITGNPFYGSGCWEARIAPSNSSIIYAIFGGQSNTAYLIKTTDKCNTWAICPCLTLFNADPNGPNRTEGQKMAVDPANANVVYFSDSDGNIYVTTDGGTTCTKLNPSTIPSSASAHGAPGIAFDQTSGTTGGKTNRIIIPVFNVGVYISTNAGSTWAASSGAPTAITKGKMASDGYYYAIDGGPNVYRLSPAGVWTTIRTSANGNVGLAGIACDPNNAGHMVVELGGTLFDESTNANSGTPTWGGNYGYYGSTTDYNSTGVPWYHNVSVAYHLAGGAWYYSHGDSFFDPNVSGRVWIFWGCGVMYTNSITAVTINQPFYDQTGGIENLVGSHVTWPPGYYPLLSCEDRAIWCLSSPNTYPQGYGPNYQYDLRLGMGNDYAKSSPNFVVALAGGTGDGGPLTLWTATDGGVSNTWTLAPVQPSPSSAFCNGSIAVSTPLNWVVISYADQKAYVTQDGGNTWFTPATLPTGSAFTPAYAQSVHARWATADHVNTGTFYLLSGNGVYRSTDAGSTWTLMLSGTGPFNPNFGFNDVIKAVPGHAGNLFYIPGPILMNPTTQPSTSAKLLRSTDGGATWNDVSNGSYTILGPNAYGFGKAAVGQSYPAIIMFGWINGVYGIWESDDYCATWFTLGTFPAGRLDLMNDATGNLNVYQEWVVSFGGSSLIRYGQASGY